MRHVAHISNKKDYLFLSLVPPLERVAASFWQRQAVDEPRRFPDARLSEGTRGIQLNGPPLQYDASSGNRWDRTPTEGVPKCQKPRLFRVPYSSFAELMEKLHRYFMN